MGQSVKGVVKGCQLTSILPWTSRDDAIVVGQLGMENLPLDGSGLGLVTHGETGDRTSCGHIDRRERRGGRDGRKDDSNKRETHGIHSMKYK